ASCRARANRASCHSTSSSSRVRQVFQLRLRERLPPLRLPLPPALVIFAARDLLIPLRRSASYLRSLFTFPCLAIPTSIRAGLLSAGARYLEVHSGDPFRA